MDADRAQITGVLTRDATGIGSKNRRRVTCTPRMLTGGGAAESQS